MVAVILMAVGQDRPGLTQSLAEAIMEADGNWLESQFGRLGSKFVGSVLVELPQDRLSQLERAAAGMDSLGFHVSILPSDDGPVMAGIPLTFELVGRDRPGIVQEVASALAQLGINIEDLDTATERSAMSGGTLFRARARVRVPEGVAMVQVQNALENISGEIMVDLEEQPN